jgi:Sulfatase
LDRPNVVVIVLDTLRGDFAAQLRQLEKKGFVRLDAVAPSSWTLPSHVSMFTGQLPSSHGVREYPDIAWRDLMHLSKQRLAQGSLLDWLGGRGYTTYGFTANMFVTPQFGFKFDHFYVFEGTAETREKAPGRPGARFLRPFVSALFREDRLGRIARWLAIGVGGTALRLLGVRDLEKGSKLILESVRGTEFKGPFFAFVNLMEAHQPYLGSGIDTLTVRLSLLGLSPPASWWREMYPEHAGLAMSRGMEVVSLFERYEPLIIVTSDHGQLLGKDGRYGHGFSLDESLLEVPLLVRYPGGGAGPDVKGRFTSLTDVRELVQKTVGGEECALGDDFAIAESWEEANYRLPSEAPDGDMHRTFSGRVRSGMVRVFGKGGSALFNRETGEVQSFSDGMSKEEVASLSERIPPVTSVGFQPPAEEPSTKDDEAVLKRLKDLGYE